jgi:transcriptional regulator with XRE-family HTH domain
MTSKMYPMVLGRVVAYLRQQKGWNQAQLAQALGTTQSTVSRIERGEVVPDALVFRSLATVFEMSTDDLHDKIDQAVERAGNMARAASPRLKQKKKENWWDAALVGLGALGLVALIGAAVAALLGEDE